MTESQPRLTSSRLGPATPAPRGHRGREVLRSSKQTMLTTTVSPQAQGTNTAGSASGSSLGGSGQRADSWQVASSLISSFKYAWAGVRYAFVTQRNFRIHTFIGSSALLLGALLEISAAEMAAIAITVALVIALELINTAIEAVVDLTVKRSYHELAKIAKDCAAGAVLVAASAALIVAAVILLPPLLTFANALLAAA